MNPVDPTVENEVPLSNVNHEVPQISEVNNEVPQDQPNMTSVAVDASLSTDASPSAIGTRKLTSNVWNHFRRKKVNGMDKAICNYCEKPLSGNRKHGTTHLREHFKICPRRTVSDIRQKILIKEKNKGDFVIKSFQFDQETSRCMLAKMIILHEYPLTIVEHHGFHKLLASLQPLFKVPCRNTIKSDILKLYDYEKTKVLSLLECNKGRIALTTDMWTASNQRKGFLALIAHFIDDNWTLQSRILRFAYVRSPHTSEVLANVIVKSMMDWNIDRNISTITVDNCSTNDSLINNVLHKLDHSTLMLGGTLFHMRCAAHILNLVVQDDLDVIAPSVEKIRESVAYWRASLKREQKFDDVARIMCLLV
ncbi:zinc finger BED domain-containing protein RICESLEEPER 2-like [Zingiber officinale]|uniref:zinc finger BED domain-containing protein RICESLEEPER 2-like n=1 Tax=Zingiber officinale TaxID=94328 RepID=UPI001C4D0E3F|nr:zinc finger BED domain-containing protein RICESLEEPER 2-like [Zingiber officinale]